MSLRSRGQLNGGHAGMIGVGKSELGEVGRSSGMPCRINWKAMLGKRRRGPSQSDRNLKVLNGHEKSR